MLDLAALQVTAELVLVVARHTQRMPGSHHAHHQTQHSGAVRPAVDEVADEDCRTALGMHGVHGPAECVAHQLIAQPAEQGLQLGTAAVDVADDVERAGQMAQIVEPPLRDDLGGLHLLLAPQDVHLAEALALQVPQRTAQFTLVALDDPAWQPGPVGARRIACGADLLGDVQDDRHGEYVVLPGQPHQLGTRLRLHIGGVHDRQPPGGQPLARDEVQHLERFTARALIVLVVADQPPAEVGGEDLGRPEVPGGEGGLAGTGGSDQHHEREVGHGERAPCGLGPGLRLGLTSPLGPAPLPVLVRVLVLVSVLRTAFLPHAAASFPVVEATLPSLLLLSSRLRPSSRLRSSSRLPPSSPAIRKCASWVGGPTSGSSGPTGPKLTS